jgi:hypothetical protein
MRIHTILIAALVLIAQPALAQFKPVEVAVETSAKRLSIPVSVNGVLGFEEPCPGECDENKRMRLTPATTFFVDGKAVKFDEFRKRYAAMRLDDTSYALVSYDVETETVTRVHIGQ